MAKLDGSWDCVVESPIGRQSFVFTIRTAGDRFSGRTEGGLGGMDIDDGMVEGDTLSWSMPVPKPFPMTLACRATIDGDTLDGSVAAGPFGSFPVKGKRIG